MDLSNCNFRTARLLLREWHSLDPDEWDGRDLSEAVISILTEPVTRSLPPTWQGDYTTSRAKGWIRERDSEGITLLAVSGETRMAVGLMILFQQVDDEVADAEIRVGYLLAESAWGSGMATEMVTGFVQWCRAQKFVGMITAGVEFDNHASRRVLEKCGLRLESGETPDRSELVYRLRLS